MTHQMIRRFSLEGQVDDGNIEKGRRNLERTVEEMMRDSGFVPLLDLQPAWATWYDEANEQMHFKLTMHAVFVGEGQSWEIDGITGTKRVPRSTPPASRGSIK